MMPPKLRSIVEQKESSSDANSEQQGAPSMTSTREEQLSTKIYQISIDQYNRGVKLFESNNFDDAKECFKDALAARLVSHGPDSDQVLITHHYLRLIAHKQGDQCKSEYHVLHYSNNANQNALLLLEGFSRHLVFSLFITVLFIIDKHVKTILTTCQLEF